MFGLTNQRSASDLTPLVCRAVAPSDCSASLAPQEAQDQIDVQLIVAKKLIKRQERVPDLEHRRYRRKDPFHEQGRPASNARNVKRGKGIPETM